MFYLPGILVGGIIGGLRGGSIRDHAITKSPWGAAAKGFIIALLATLFPLLVISLSTSLWTVIPELDATGPVSLLLWFQRLLVITLFGCLCAIWSTGPMGLFAGWYLYTCCPKDSTKDLRP
jgi:hypothetical protein